MRNRTLAILALSIAVIAPAAFAQQNGTQSEAASGAVASAQPGGVEVTGTIVSVNATSVEVKLDSVAAAEGAPVAGDVAVGKTAEFKLDASTQMPRTLKTGDPVDLWFTSENGSMVATRVALAVSGEEHATTSSDNSATASSGENNASSQSQPASTAASTAAQQGQHLPKTGSPLPLIGLLGVAALVAAFALRFVLKA
jgi:cobalamin biosynthesis Mg chelatase CobN